MLSGGIVILGPGLRQRVENKIAFQFIFITETTQSFSNDAFCACKECQFEIIFSGIPFVRKRYL